MGIASLKSNRWFLPGVAVVIFGCLVWIAFSVMGERSGNRPSSGPPTDAAHLAANELTAKIHEEPHLNMIYAIVNPDDPKSLKITGEVYRKSDLELLDKRLKELRPTETMMVDVEVLLGR